MRRGGGRFRGGRRRAPRRRRSRGLGVVLASVLRCRAPDLGLCRSVQRDSCSSRPLKESLNCRGRRRHAGRHRRSLRPGVFVSSSLSPAAAAGTTVAARIAAAPRIPLMPLLLLPCDKTGKDSGQQAPRAIGQLDQIRFSPNGLETSAGQSEARRTLARINRDSGVIAGHARRVRPSVRPGHNRASDRAHHRSPRGCRHHPRRAACRHRVARAECPPRQGRE